MNNVPQTLQWFSWDDPRGALVITENGTVYTFWGRAQNGIFFMTRLADGHPAQEHMVRIVESLHDLHDGIIVQGMPFFWITTTGGMGVETTPVKSIILAQETVA